MKNVFFTAGFIVALFLELAVGGKVALFGARPPLAGAVLFLWFWDVRLYPRLFLAFLGGVIIDSISLYPFGTNTAVFTAIAGSTGALHYFFSNIESLMTRTVGISINIFLSTNLAVILGYLIGVVGGAQSGLTPLLLLHVLLASIIWALTLPAFLLLLVAAGKFIHEKIKVF